MVELVGSVYVEDDYIRLVSLNDDIDFEGNRLFPDILLPRDENTRIIGNFATEPNGERKFPDIKLYLDDNPRIIGKVVAAFTPIEINNIF